MNLKCPVLDCKHRSNSPESLFGHLYTAHKKNELVATIVWFVSVGGLESNFEVLPNGTIRYR